MIHITLIMNKTVNKCTKSKYFFIEIVYKREIKIIIFVGQNNRCIYYIDKCNNVPITKTTSKFLDNFL